MRIKNCETESDRIYRQAVLIDETKKSFPIMGVILLVFIGLLVYMYFDSSRLDSSKYGVGDPYHCIDCSGLGFACKEHKHFNSNEALDEYIHRVSFVYERNTSIDEQIELIYDGEKYNTDCDFCRIDRAECYGCSYDRQRIWEKAEEVSSDSMFIARLCDSCWESKAPVCNVCRESLYKYIKENYNE